jgi:hypothetical protein
MTDADYVGPTIVLAVFVVMLMFFFWGECKVDPFTTSTPGEAGCYFDTHGLQPVHIWILVISSLIVIEIVFICLYIYNTKPKYDKKKHTNGKTDNIIGNKFIAIGIVAAFWLFVIPSIYYAGLGIYLFFKEWKAVWEIMLPITVVLSSIIGVLLLIFGYFWINVQITKYIDKQIDPPRKEKWKKNNQEIIQSTLRESMR